MCFSGQNLDASRLVYITFKAETKMFNWAEPEPGPTKHYSIA